MFVEDQDGERELGASVAEEHDFSVITAASLDEAHRKMRSNPSLSVLLTDIHLDPTSGASDKNKDGRRIAATAKLENKYVVVCGTSGRFNEQETCADENSPFDFFTNKNWIDDPQQAEGLFEKIRSALAQKSSDRTARSKMLKDSLSKDTDLSEKIGYVASEFHRLSEVKDAELMILDNDDVERIAGDDTNLIEVPVPVWVKSCQRGEVTKYYVEVYRFSQVAVIGESREEAIQTLLLLFQKLREYGLKGGKFENFEKMGISIEVCERLLKYLGRDDSQ